MHNTQTGRYDIYTGYHKLLRSRLYEASVDLGRANFAAVPDSDADDALALVRETVDLLVDHAAKEDAHVRRLLHAYDGKLAVELDAAHRALDDALSEVDRLVVETARRQGRERATSGNELYARFNVVVADQVRHMAQEELEANAVLWAHLSDRELAEVHQAIIQTDPPERTAWLLERLLPIWSLPERAGMWRQTSANAPPQFAAMVRQIGERALGSDGWARVERAATA